MILPLSSFPVEDYANGKLGWMMDGLVSARLISANL
jgi:hypothetical protein